MISIRTQLCSNLTFTSIRIGSSTNMSIRSMNSFQAQFAIDRSANRKLWNITSIRTRERRWVSLWLIYTVVMYSLKQQKCQFHSRMRAASATKDLSNQLHYRPTWKRIRKAHEWETTQGIGYYSTINIIYCNVWREAVLFDGNIKVEYFFNDKCFNCYKRQQC